MANHDITSGSVRERGKFVGIEDHLGGSGIPTRGLVTLWVVAAVVLAIGVVELYYRRDAADDRGP